MSVSAGSLPVVSAFFHTRETASAAGLKAPPVRFRQESHNFSTSINSGDTCVA
jgi:hypothetical protein